MRGSATYNQTYGTPAAYKAWAQTISDVMNQASVREPSVTGQVNWASVSTEAPTTVRDYEVFALGGSLQATAPIFIRFDYHGSTGGGIDFTVGTTTDTSGNLGGLSMPLVKLQSSGIVAQNNQWVWASSDRDSYFTMLYNLDPLASGLDGVGMVVVERTRNLDGTPSAEGFHVWRWSSNSATATDFLGGWSKVYGAQTQALVVDYNFATLIPNAYNLNTTFIGNTSYTFPAYTYASPFVRGASKAIMFAFSVDFPRGQEITVNHYGQAMKWVSLGDALANKFGAMSTQTAAAAQTLMPIIRWE